MVDEVAYRQAHEQSAVLPCVFQGALLACQAECLLAVRGALAERETLVCSQAPAHINCETLDRLLLERATFPLRLHPMAPLTHATVQRLQCGGLQGLQAVLAASSRDVHQMIGVAHERYGSLIQLPWAQIVASIMAWRPRRRAQT